VGSLPPDILPASQCRVCRSAARDFAQALILGKYHVRYYRCEFCGFIQTEDPYWLSEAYKSPIAEIDIGVAYRAIELCRPTQAVILTLFNCNAQFVDYGGGYGLFVRVMRDRGFDFYNFDRYCPNLFARTFEATEGRAYELATAFEVFEHFPRPAEDLRHVLSFTRNVLFNTLLIPASIPRPHEWWYYATETGQHVSFYTLRSLKVLADQSGLQMYSDGLQLHLFTDKRFPPRFFSLLARPTIARSITAVLRRRLAQRSLLPGDFERISGLRMA